VVDVVRQRGSVEYLHRLDPFDADPGAAGRSGTDPQVWWCDAADAALVLGSRQSIDLVDQAALTAAGLGIVRRRSGGGAVIVRPDVAVWVDIVMPHGVAPDDIRGSMVWIGERWMAAIAPLLVGGSGARELDVHRGGMVATAWSDLVCFAGLGPGEVLLGGRKLVGLSQRRTRLGIRIQGMVYRSPVTADIARFFVGEVPTGEPPEPAWSRELAPQTVAEALAAQLSA